MRVHVYMCVWLYMHIDMYVTCLYVYIQIHVYTVDPTEKDSPPLPSPPPNTHQIGDGADRHVARGTGAAGAAAAETGGRKAQAAAGGADQPWGGRCVYMRYIWLFGYDYTPPHPVNHFKPTTPQSQPCIGDRRPACAGAAYHALRGDGGGPAGAAQVSMYILYILWVYIFMCVCVFCSF